ncbi:MAG: histidine kinase [Sandaracinaceae bacterium]|nr:histidine kinase [Sandaracinaceae bacterium]
MDAGHPAPSETVFASTMRALVAPRRFVPILVLAIPIVMTQAPSPSRWAFPVGILMVLGFVLFAPASYRFFFGEQARGPAALRAIGYLAGGAAVVGTAGLLVPAVVDLRSSFLTVESSLLISLGLYYVGGFGLGRDIELELALERERRRTDALLRQAEHAQLLAIRAHLDPHFLFNTLNAIAEFCREDGAAAERAILELSAMLRTLMEGLRTPSWALERDVGLARSLARLYAARDPGKYVFEEEVDPAALSREVPAMILLPAIENAWKHGPSRGRRGPVRLVVRASELETLVRIENPGRFEGRRDGGEGLSMIEARLVAAYEGRARFHIETVEERTVATFALPFGPAGRDNPSP